MPSSQSTCRTQSAHRLAPRNARQLGMTLLEIMIVLAIIGLVMGVVIGPIVMDQYRAAQRQTAESEAKSLALQAYGRWLLQHQSKTCPQDIRELAEYANDGNVDDPWGRPYIMHCGADGPAELDGKLGIVSRGADGESGTDDDIYSWPRKNKNPAG